MQSRAAKSLIALEAISVYHSKLGDQNGSPGYKTLPDALSSRVCRGFGFRRHSPPASRSRPVGISHRRCAARAGRATTHRPLGLLDKAHGLSNVRAQPYALKTSFIASGGLASDGSWVLEDIAPKGGGYRWTAQGPNYSAINLYPASSANGLYGNQPSGILPLRLTQVRSAIFFIYPGVGPNRR